MTPRVVGIDLSLTATGIAESDGQTRTIRTGPGDHLADQHDRLAFIVREVWASVVVATKPQTADLVVIEGPSYNSTGAGSWDRAGLWWLVVASLLDEGVPVAVVPPSVLKRYATGKGNATKADMRMAMFKRTGLDERDDNRVDAWWLRAMGLDHLGHAPVELPQAQRDGLAKVAWPVPLETP